MRKLRRQAQVARRLGVDAGQHVHKLGDERHLMAVVEVKSPDSVARGLVAEVVLLRHGLLVQVHHRGPQIEVRLELIVQVQAKHTLGGHAEAVVLAAHTDRRVRREYALVSDAHRTHGVVHRIVHILYQRHAAGRDSYRAGSHAVAKRNLSAYTCGVVAFQIELVSVGILSRQRLRHRVQRVEAVLVGVVVVAEYSPQVLAEGFDIREEHPARRSLYDAASEGRRVEPVEDSVGVIIALRGVHAVEPEDLDQRFALLRAVGEEAYTQPPVGVFIQHIEAEVVPAQLAAPQEVHILHHQPPQGSVGVHRRALEELHNERVRVVHTVGCQLTHLIHRGVADHLVLEGHGQHLVVAQRLVEAYEAQLAVERILVAAKQSRTLYLLIVHPARQPQSLHVARDGVDAAHGAGVHQLQQVVAAVGGLHGTCAADAGVRRCMLAEVCQGQYVAVLRHGGTDIGAPHLYAQYLHVAVHHRQRGHGVVVVVVEILRYEEVAVLLILVGPYLELVAAGAALHLHVLRARLLLAQHGVHRQLAELQLRVEAEELLAALYQRGVQRE